MIRIMLTSGFLTLVNVSFSQTKYFISAGTNYSSMTSDLTEEFGFDSFRQAYIDLGGSATSTVKNSIRVGFYLTVETDLALTKKSLLRFGVKYMTLGDSYFFKTDDVVLQSSNGSESDEKFKLRPRIDYLGIPLKYGYRIGDKIRILVGANSSIPIKNVIRTNRFDVNGSDVKQKWDTTENPIKESKLLVMLATGFNYSVIEGKVPLIVDFSFNYGLTNIYNDTQVTIFNDSTLWSFEVGLGVGL